MLGTPDVVVAQPENVTRKNRLRQISTTFRLDEFYSGWGSAAAFAGKEYSSHFVMNPHPTPRRRSGTTRKGHKEKSTATDFNNNISSRRVLLSISIDLTASILCTSVGWGGVGKRSRDGTAHCAGEGEGEGGSLPTQRMCLSVSVGWC